METALTAFATFFATVGPIEAAVLFAAWTARLERAERTRMALRATGIATIILVAFTFLGQPMLARLGVSISALQVAGGVILFLIAMDMVFARPEGTFKLTPPEDEEAQSKDDVAVFPLATPLLAGPGAMSAGILLAAGADGAIVEFVRVLAALLAVMAVTLVLLLVAPEISRVLGVTAQRVLMRVFGILLSAIAVQSIFDGLRSSPLGPLLGA